MQQILAVGAADSVRQWRAEAEHVCIVDKRDIGALRLQTATIRSVVSGGVRRRPGSSERPSVSGRVAALGRGFEPQHAPHRDSAGIARFCPPPLVQSAFF
jgi:hypothetical protein